MQQNTIHDTVTFEKESANSIKFYQAHISEDNAIITKTAQAQMPQTI